jgi:hypothetical protein
MLDVVLDVNSSAVLVPPHCSLLLKPDVVQGKKAGFGVLERRPLSRLKIVNDHGFQFAEHGLFREQGKKIPIQNAAPRWGTAI